MKKLTLNTIIDFMLFMYIMSLYFLTQQEGLHLISNAIALVLMALIWIGLLIKRKKIRINSFSITYILFIIICMISIFYAIDGETALVKTRTLALNFGLMFTLINYINSIDKIRKIIHFFIISGFMTSIYIISTSDFPNLTRMGSQLGNVNAIGMLVTLSTIFCFYIILEDKIYKLVPISIINIITIFLTGSRKSLLFLIISISLILLFLSKKSLTKKVKYLFIASIVMGLVIYLVFNVPIFYQIIGKRMENLLGVLLVRGTTEGSLNTRTYMIEFGINRFKERPLLGYGIDNYRFLLNNRLGEFTYSHNNIVELLVGTGIIGAFTYYLSQLLIIQDSIKVSKYNTDTNLIYLFITVIIGYIIISVSLIYYDNKAFNIILAMSSVYPRLLVRENTNDISLTRWEVQNE